jgi:hypothetical protein
MSELNTPYEVNKTYSLDGYLAMASIVDCNGIWFIDCFEADAVEVVKRLNGYQGLEQQLLEANAKNERLKSKYRGAFYDNGSESTEYKTKEWFMFLHRLGDIFDESTAQSLALHDADVIGGYQELLDKRLAGQQSPLSTRAIAMGFANEHIEQLRNSIKGGEQNDK